MMSVLLCSYALVEAVSSNQTGPKKVLGILLRAYSQQRPTREPNPEGSRSSHAHPIPQCLRNTGCHLPTQHRNHSHPSQPSFFMTEI